MLCCILAELLEILLERSVRLLGGSLVAGLEFLTELGDQLADLAWGAGARASTAVMMVMAFGAFARLCTARRLRSLILKVLLNGRVVLLSGFRVSGLDVLGKLGKSLLQGIAALGG